MLRSGIRAVLRRWEANTISDRPRLEVVSAFVVAPLVEEAVFRAGIFRVAGAGWRVAVGSAALFGLLHLRFGRWFVGYTFVGGLVLWATYARTGYWSAVLLHAVANLVDLSVGWRRCLNALDGYTDAE